MDLVIFSMIPINEICLEQVKYDRSYLKLTARIFHTSISFYWVC